MSNLISVGKIIDTTWNHYAKHIQTLMRVTLWLFLVSAISILWIMVKPGESIEISTSEILTQSIFGLATFVISMTVGFWIFLTLLQVINATETKKSVDTKQAGKKSWKLFIAYTWVISLKFLATIAPLLLILPGLIIIALNITGPLIPWLSAIGILLTFLGVILAFMGVVYISTIFQYAEYSLVFENVKGTAALKAAKQLVNGRFWATIWRIIIPKIVFVIPVIFINFVLVTFFTFLTPSFAGANIDVLMRISQIGDNIISTSVAVLTTPLFIIADYYVYSSLRKAKK